MTEQVLSGELSRGVGAANMESVRTIFTVSAPGVPSSINGVLSFLLKADLRMPVPFDQVGWENPNFTVSKSLLVNRRGGMVENGTAYQGSQKVPYQFVYKCVSF